ncbi:MAG: PAS domain S-box protein [Gemmatimonadetes bacterium]|nr:PAS domain S-box protein [Gemmatimonadota bacterium]
MSKPRSSGATPTPQLDPGLRDLLRDLPESQSVALEALIGERDRLVALAERRAERLQRLHEASAGLSRSLDRDDVERELARQVARIIPCDGVIVTRAGDAGTPGDVVLHWKDGGPEDATDASPACAAVAEVARTGRASRVQEPEEPADSAHAVLAVPLMAGYRLAGVLAVYGAPGASFGSEEEELLLTIGATAATSLVNASLFAEGLREKRQSEALAAMASAVGSSLKLADVLRLALRHSVAILGARGGGVALRRGDYMHIVATEGGEAAAIEGLYVPLDQSPTVRAVLEGRAYLRNAPVETRVVYDPTGTIDRIGKIIAAPLLTPDGTIGMLVVANRSADFTDVDARVLERIASQLALAVVNAWLYEEASEATRELSAAFDAIAGGLAVLDAEGFVVRHNARLATFAGLGDGGSLVGRGLFEALLHEEREITDDDPIGIAIRRQTVGRGTLRAAWSSRVFDLVSSPHPNGGAVVTVDDVTAFHALEERHRNLLEVAADAIYTLDRHARFTSANEACAALLGVPRDQLIGRSIVPSIDPTELDEVAAQWSGSLAGALRRYECHVVRPDGTRRLVSVSNTPIRRGDDVTSVLGVARDVTEEREQARALERAEQRYARLVESAEDAICTVDEEGNFTAVNRALERAMGRPRETLIGTHFTDLLLPEDRPDKWQMFAASLAGRRERREVRYLAADGTVRVSSMISAPIYDGGRVSGVLGILRDVTEERTLQEQVARREKLAALGEMVGGVAHEMNSPLTGILAFGQLLQGMPGDSDDARRAVETIVNEAKRAARIVGKLLTFARQNPPERMPTDLNQVLLDTIELRRYPLKMQQIHLQTDLDSSLPLTWADPFQLQQVFINLLSNAEQALATQPGSRLATVRTARRDDTLAVTVSDTGPGIAPEHLPHIFNPFYTTKPRGIGTGLGLSISFGIVREHGGTLQVYSEPGKGATFEVLLPIVAPPTPGNR